MTSLNEDLKEKQAGKYSKEREAEAQGWIEAITGESVGEDFQAGLKDGIILCNLVNKLKPGCVRKVNKGATPFVQMENIQNFLKACQSEFGMSEVDTFATKDLYEADNLGSVVDTIFSLGSRAQKLDGYDGPRLGAAHAEKNVREFTSEQLAKGKYTQTMQTWGSQPTQPKLEEGGDKIKKYGKKDELSKFEHAGATQQTRGDHGYQPELEEHGDKIKRYGKKDEMGEAERGPSRQTQGSYGYQPEHEEHGDKIKRYGKKDEMGQAERGPSRQTQGSYGYQPELGEGGDKIKRYGKKDEMGEAERGPSRQTQGSYGYQPELGEGGDKIKRYGKHDEMGEAERGPSRQTQGSYGYQPEHERTTDSILRHNVADEMPEHSNVPSQQTQGSFGYEDKREYVSTDKIVRNVEELEIDKAKAKARTDVAGGDS